MMLRDVSGRSAACVCPGVLPRRAGMQERPSRTCCRSAFHGCFAIKCRRFSVSSGPSPPLSSWKPLVGLSCARGGETRVGSGRQVPACESGFSAVRVASEESDQSCKSQLHPGLKNSPSPPSVFLSHLPSRGACPHAAQDLHLLRCSKSLLDLVHSVPVR